MAAPVIESSSVWSSDDGTGLSVTITKPTGTTEGDLLVAIVGNDSSDNTAANSQYAAQDGWSLAYSGGSGTSDNRTAVLYRVAGASEPADYTISYTGTLYRRTGAIYRISGADSTPNVIGTYNEGASTTLTANSITTTEDDCLVFAVHGYDGGDASFSSYTAGWTMEDEFKGRTTVAAADIKIGVATKDSHATAGATGNSSVTASLIDGFGSNQVAFAPSAAESETFTPQTIIY